MNLDKVILYLENGYPFTGEETYTQAVEQLTEAINNSSITAVTKAIREHTSCPRIVATEDDGKYSFKACVKEVWLNFDKHFISKGAYRFGWNGFYHTGNTFEGIACFQNESMPQCGGTSLFSWIQYGNICDECGIAYVGGEGNLCPSCKQNYQLYPYHTHAEEVLGTEETEDTLFGVELEYEDITVYDVAKNLKGHAIAKRDGSIHSGVEIVTRPACVETHKKSLLPFYEKIKVAARSNTGMHVHVDKSKLTNYQVGFMLEFLNKDTLIPHITKVAGRNYSENTYCRTTEGMKMSWGNRFDEESYKLVKTPTNKYSPLNTGKAHTIEVRIFSSPESHEEMCAKLDFVAALVKYSSPYAVSVKSLKDKFSWETFTDFVESNRKEFPHFYNYFLKEAKSA